MGEKRSNAGVVFKKKKNIARALEYGSFFTLQINAIS